MVYVGMRLVFWEPSGRQRTHGGSHGFYHLWPGIERQRSWAWARVLAWGRIGWLTGAQGLQGCSSPSNE
jgi:hypothetical protein